MNWQHLKAVMWLRWRLSVNQFRRGGTLNAVLGTLWLAFVLVAGTGSFLTVFLLGFFLLPRATPDQLMLVWDGIVLVFLFAWTIGLLSDLQKGEALSIEKLLYLPVSPVGAFLLNYLGSLVSVTLLLFASMMTGLCMALLLTRGIAMLVVPLLVVSFTIMVTAITYQIRSWLFSLMVNRRRRRTVIAIMTLLFIVIVQTPNIINMTVLRTHRKQVRETKRLAVEKLDEARHRGDIDSDQYAAQRKELAQRWARQKRESRARMYQTVLAFAEPVHWVLPIGWLPYGVRAAARGNPLPGMLGTLGAGAIGFFSLWFAYCGVLRLYTGVYTSKKRAAVKNPVRTGRTTRARFMERELPGVPDQAAATALGTLRILMRGPEGKMMLLTPVILLVIFGAMIFAGRDHHVPEMIRPLLGLGSIGVVMLSFGQLLSNVFAIDRAGFRSYVLAPCPRRDILLGKNIATTMIGFCVCCMALVLVQVFAPMHVTHVFATLLQFLNCFLVYCMLGNVISLVAPAAVSPGSMKPKQAGFTAIFLHVIIAMMSPLVLLPAFVGWGVELLLDSYFGVWFPAYLTLSTLEFVAMLWIYHRVLAAEARLFDQRAQAVLDVVTMHVE